MGQITTKAFLDSSNHLMIGIAIGRGEYVIDEMGAIALMKALAVTVNQGRQIPGYQPDPQASAIVANRNGELIPISRDREF